MTTRRATNPGETSRQDPTAQVAAELSFDEVRVAFPAKVASLFEEGLEVFADDGVQDALLGFATAIGARKGIRCGSRVALVDGA